jgi:hypothetical protein
MLGGQLLQRLRKPQPGRGVSDLINPVHQQNGTTTRDVRCEDISMLISEAVLSIVKNRMTLACSECFAERRCQQGHGRKTVLVAAWIQP